MIVAIFLVLSAFVIPLFLNQIGRAQESKALADVELVADTVRDAIALGEDPVITGGVVSGGGVLVTVGGTVELVEPPDVNGIFLCAGD